MKNTNQKNTGPSKNGSNSTPSKGATNPGKPNNDPDQTPDKEVKNVPKAKQTADTGSKNKIGFKK